MANCEGLPSTISVSVSHPIHVGLHHFLEFFHVFPGIFHFLAPWASFSDRNVIAAIGETSWRKDKSQEAQWRGTAVPLLLQAWCGSLLSHVGDHPLGTVFSTKKTKVFVLCNESGVIVWCHTQLYILYCILYTINSDFYKWIYVYIYIYNMIF